MLNVNWCSDYKVKRFGFAKLRRIYINYISTGNLEVFDTSL